MTRHGKRFTTRQRHAQRGVYAIEYAFVFLFLFGLLYTIICYGILFTFKVALQNAAEDGARAALRYQPTIAQRLTEAQSVATQKTQGWWPAALGTPAPEATLAQAGASCGSEWNNRCSISVTITMNLRDGSQKHLFALPLPYFAMPDALSGQATVLLEGAAI